MADGRRWLIKKMAVFTVKFISRVVTDPKF
jgi:hypothetical protein